MLRQCRKFCLTGTFLRFCASRIGPIADADAMATPRRIAKEAAKQLAESSSDVVELRFFDSPGLMLARPDGYIAYSYRRSGSHCRYVRQRHNHSSGPNKKCLSQIGEIIS